MFEKLACWLVCSVWVVKVAGWTDDPVTLHIGGTFPMESGSGGWAGGEACLPAVQMALEDVNSRSDVLPGYILHMNTSNSKCQPGLAMQQLYDFLYTPPTKLMLLTGCSPVTTVISEAAPVWKLVVISYGGSSPALSNRERFPTLFRTHPSANMQNPTRIRIMEKFKWKKITILMSVEEVFTATAKDLENLARRKGIRVERQSFYGDPTDAMKTLLRQDARIIIGLYYVTEARKVLCQAYHHGLYGRKHVWFLIGWYADTWYIPPPDEHLNCTAEQMAKAAEYHFTTESVMLSRDDNPAISGMTGKQFQKRLALRLQKETDNVGDVGGFPEAPLAYDAVWALALAFNCTRQHLPLGVKLEDFSYTNQMMASTLFQCVKNTSFRGVSGKVMFSDSGDRIARTQIEQMQNGKYKIMGYYDATSGEVEWYGNEKWFSIKGPPPDSTIIQRAMLTVSQKVYYPAILFATLGIILCAAIYTFTKKHASRLILIQSQPECNNMLIAGCSLCLFALFLLGLPSDDFAIPEAAFSFLCHARITILLFGFTFAYGSMFAKVWIVHRMGATQNQQLASRQKDEYKPLLSNYSEKRRRLSRRFHEFTMEEGTPWEGIRTLISTMVGRQSYATRKASGQAYGALLEKRNTLLNQPIPATKFYMVIAALFAFDFFIVCVWIFLDPLQPREERFPLQDAPIGTDDDIMILPIIYHCQSAHQEVWIGILLGYKCLLLVFGLFLSYESRNLKLRFVNDSRLVGLAIYNVAIVTLITAPVVTLLIRGQANANFAFISLTVLICTYISLGLVFVPKIRHIYKVPPSADEIQISGNGLVKTLSKPDQRRYELLRQENESLQAQINEKERRISQCRERLDALSSKDGAEPQTPRNRNNNIVSNNKSVSDEATYSTPTTLTTTALIELQPSGESAGRYNDDDEDRCSTSSDEILL
ncbi:unnamed protein product [Caenorhabditis auriculariae]|uniref:G-protein coupled receptors family 3 profile domain-containing protein n=1 Tax=Caenorhabditis auriculariae TaxID=2777116 RepID=A0A8S1H942_9PELO|nr:unnamed protein product [Caenorhabditis auriculariae]